MANEFWRKPVIFNPEEQLPDDDVGVIVLCRHFRCLGYLHEGIWRQVYDDEQINDVIGWAV